MAKMRTHVTPITCMNCGANDFTAEEGRLPTKWGGGTHLLVFYVCNPCGFVMHFYGKRSLVQE